MVLYLELSRDEKWGPMQTSVWWGKWLSDMRLRGGLPRLQAGTEDSRIQSPLQWVPILSFYPSQELTLHKPHCLTLLLLVSGQLISLLFPQEFKCVLLSCLLCALPEIYQDLITFTHLHLNIRKVFPDFPGGEFPVLQVSLFAVLHSRCCTDQCLSQAFLPH